MALWTPADLSIPFWLDASDSSTLFDSASGGSLVASGGTVGRIEDKGTSGFDLTQATATDRPVRQTAVQNSLDVLRFTSDYLTSSGYSLDTSQQGLTRFLLAKTDTTSDNQVSFNSAAAGTSVQNLSTGLYSYERPSVYGRTALSTTTLDFAIYIAIYDGSQPATHSDRIKLYRNGTHLPWTLTSGTIGTTTGSGSGCDLGRPFGNSTAFWKGDIGECGTVQNALSTYNRQKLEGYLAHKWGLTGFLPADHPYKFEAPEQSTSPRINGGLINSSLIRGLVV